MLYDRTVIVEINSTCIWHSNSSGVFSRYSSHVDQYIYTEYFLLFSIMLCLSIYFKGTAVLCTYIFIFYKTDGMPHLLHTYRERAPGRHALIVIMVLKNTKNINFTDGSHSTKRMRTLCGRARVVLIFKPTHSRC